MFVDREKSTLRGRIRDESQNRAKLTMHFVYRCFSFYFDDIHFFFFFFFTILSFLKKASRNDFELTLFGYFYLENLYTNFTVNTELSLKDLLLTEFPLKVNNRYV